MMQHELVEMAMGFARSRVLTTAARLGVADALAQGERGIQELAQECGAHQDSLHRLLRALANLGLFEETTPGRFKLTDRGHALRRDAPGSAWAGVVFWGEFLADSWSHLTECVKTGEPAARAMERAGVVSRWAQDPNAAAIFRAVMGTAPAEDYSAIAEAFDFSQWHTVADIGGGGGALIVAILRRYPHLTGMLVDRPASVEAATPRIAREALEARCRLAAVDVLEEAPPPADVHVLKHVLHGYDDDRVVRILQQCRSSMPADGRVLVIEFILPRVVNSEDPAMERTFMSDLNMLAATGGKERTEADWAQLAERAGLRVLQVLPVHGETVSIVECSAAGLV